MALLWRHYHFPREKWKGSWWTPRIRLQHQDLILWFHGHSIYIRVRKDHG